jgi:hypothetical protein
MPVILRHLVRGTQYRIEIVTRALIQLHGILVMKAFLEGDVVGVFASASARVGVCWFFSL